MRPGIYLSHVPGIPKLDFRVEAATTDTVSNGRTPGQLMYWELIEKQGYTNQGQLFADWIGREDKRGQAWMTWHLSSNEWIQVSARNQKAEHDFIPGGTTLYDIPVQAVKRVGKVLELDSKFAVEHYKAPVYLPGGADCNDDEYWAHVVSYTESKFLVAGCRNERFSGVFQDARVKFLRGHSLRGSLTTSLFGKQPQMILEMGDRNEQVSCRQP
jgi:Capsule assembly protein Wzi